MWMEPCYFRFLPFLFADLRVPEGVEGLVDAVDSPSLTSSEPCADTGVVAGGTAGVEEEVTVILGVEYLSSVSARTFGMPTKTSLILSLATISVADENII